MPSIDVPHLGRILVACIFVASCATMGLGIVANRGRLGLNRSVRASMLATTLLVAASVFLLAYAFQTHDFRLRYVVHTSDRSMPWYYVVTSLWGGQDGSLLWWCFLLSVYTWLFLSWIGDKYAAFQPIIFATIASVFAFFAVLMLFAANPFSTGHGAAPADGDGLNPLLQNYWMAIHPPSLYMGLVGWAIPFAICNAALVTGRLGEEWIFMARRWTLLAWGFLSFGNLLGMFWSYEELGWGGYWAWDPVENASFMPWLFGTAYLHSVMIQERRGMLKVWNVCLICGAYFFTIFGTFLTRSGLIASVHSFAKSDIGVYFIWYMAFLAAYLVGLILYRMPKLRSVGSLESALSREFAFMLNNWILMAMLVFILVATTFPLISELLRGQTVTVGAAYYNKWMVPLGLLLVTIMGIGPLIAWRKASGKSLRDAFKVPVATAIVFALSHLLFGRAVGFAPQVEGTELYSSGVGQALKVFYENSPWVFLGICGLVLGAIAQEFWRGTVARMHATQEGVRQAFVTMFSKARRRYGGYVVHIGIVILFLGFLGSAYDIEREGVLSNGESMEVAGYHFTYRGVRTVTDLNKTMVFGDLDLTTASGTTRMSPAKFRYRTHPDMPTTEVAIRSTPLDDLYVILSTVDTNTGRATFTVKRRPLVFWVWAGGLILLLGTFLSGFPTLKEILGDERRAAVAARPAGLVTAAFFLLLALLPLLFFQGLLPSVGRAQDSSSAMAAEITLTDPTERALFSRLLCECGGCQRLPLSGCGCPEAEHMRDELRQQLASGVGPAQLERNYRERFGPQSIAVPSDSGLDRVLWAAPLGGAVVLLGTLYAVAKRWQKKSIDTAALNVNPAIATRDALDDEIDRAMDDID